MQYASRNDQYKSLSNRLLATDDGRRLERKGSRRTISVPNTLRIPKEMFLEPSNIDFEDRYSWLLDTWGDTNSTNQK